MEMSLDLPRFSWERVKPHDDESLCLVADGARFHRCSPFVDRFYHALGYTDGLRANGMLPEEFVWSIYKRDGAPKRPSCLQPKIYAYLFEYSERFRNEFGERFLQLAGRCTAPMRNDDRLCASCPMR